MRVVVAVGHMKVAGVERGELGRFVGWEAEAREASAASVVHGVVQVLDGPVAAGDGCGGPVPGGEDDQGVEDVGVEPGGVDQCVVPALDGGAQLAGQGRVAVPLVLEVGDAERDVARLVGPPARSAPVQRSVSANPRTRSQVAVRSGRTANPWPCRRAHARR